jgi:CHAT domain-containing protein
MATPPAGQEADHRRRLADLEGREQGLSAKLARAGGFARVEGDWHDLASLRAALPPNAAFLDFILLTNFNTDAPASKRRQSRYLVCLTRTKGDVRLIDLGDAKVIDQAVQQVRQALRESPRRIPGQGEVESEKHLRKRLEELSRLVVHPLLPHLPKGGQWLISPDGNLWLTPFECFVLPNGKYVIEEQSVRYLPSGRDLLQRPSARGASSGPVIVADPDFDLGHKAGRQAGVPRLGVAKRLPSTAAEANAITGPLGVYAKRTPRVLLGKEAPESVVKATKGPRVLVLSTHGFFLPKQEGELTEDRLGERGPPPGWENPLLRCGLLLAGCNEAANARDGDDGVLTGLEVVSMDLRGCEMVVLSACETGLGDVQQGEGVAGLRQAFQLAGAESVVSTLWQVPDQASAKLMALFFRNLAKGKDRATALREAQLKVIEDRRDDSAAAHPFFWAAFTLTGP